MQARPVQLLCVPCGLWQCCRGSKCFLENTCGSLSDMNVSIIGLNRVWDFNASALL